MSTHDIAILLAAATGALMVGGGMLLIWKGALVLAGTDSSTALSLEWKKDFKLSTQAPGIAFFLLGLMFSVVAIFFSIPKETEPIYITGSVDGVTELVTITAIPSFWEVTSGSDGRIAGKFTPDTEILNLRISAPGYEAKFIPSNLRQAKNRTIALPTSIRLTKTISKIETKRENIVATNFPLLPVDARASFGLVVQ